MTDQGNVSVAVAGASGSSASYGTTTDTASSVAAQLAGGFANNSLISATASGGTVTLSARTLGPNYSFTTSQTWDKFDFTSPQITISPASGGISGGVYPAFSYDAGQISVTVGGYTATVNYDQNSTTSSVATSLANLLNGDVNCPVAATLSGSTIILASKITGAAANYTLSSSSASTQFPFSSPSFSASPSGSAMTGGADPSNPFASLYATLYSYDGLGDLLRVDQKGSAPTDSSQWRTRTFTYNSLSELLTAHNPESGTISYSYDADGNLLQKTSPAPNQTGTATQTVSFCYDELHRVTKKDYTAHTFSPPACPISAPVVATLTTWARTAKAT